MSDDLEVIQFIIYYRRSFKLTRKYNVAFKTERFRNIFITYNALKSVFNIH